MPDATWRTDPGASMGVGASVGASMTSCNGAASGGWLASPRVAATRRCSRRAASPCASSRPSSPRPPSRRSSSPPTARRSSRCTPRRTAPNVTFAEIPEHVAQRRHRHRGRAVLAPPRRRCAGDPAGRPGQRRGGQRHPGRLDDHPAAGEDAAAELQPDPRPQGARRRRWPGSSRTATRRSGSSSSTSTPSTSAAARTASAAAATRVLRQARRRAHRRRGRPPRRPHPGARATTTPTATPTPPSPAAMSSSMPCVDQDAASTRPRTTPPPPSRSPWPPRCPSSRSATPPAHFVEEVKQWILDDERFGATARERRELLFAGGLAGAHHDRPRPAGGGRGGRGRACCPTPSTIPRPRSSPSSRPPATCGPWWAAATSSARPTTAKYNLAMGRGRHTGSSFKPLVLAAALQDGIPLSQIVPGARARSTLTYGNPPRPWDVEQLRAAAVPGGRSTSSRPRCAPTTRCSPS